MTQGETYHLVRNVFNAPRTKNRGLFLLDHGELYRVEKLIDIGESRGYLHLEDGRIVEAHTVDVSAIFCRCYSDEEIAEND